MSTTPAVPPHHAQQRVEAASRCPVCPAPLSPTEHFLRHRFRLSGPIRILFCGRPWTHPSPAWYPHFTFRSRTKPAQLRLTATSTRPRFPAWGKHLLLFAPLSSGKPVWKLKRGGPCRSSVGAPSCKRNYSGLLSARRLRL